MYLLTPAARIAFESLSWVPGGAVMPVQPIMTSKYLNFSARDSGESLIRSPVRKLMFREVK